MNLRANDLCASYLSDAEADRNYYEIFFEMCQKFHINWVDATEKEKAFITEVSRVTYERTKALQSGSSVSDIRPAFSA